MNVSVLSTTQGHLWTGEKEAAMEEEQTTSDDDDVDDDDKKEELKTNKKPEINVLLSGESTAGKH